MKAMHCSNMQTSAHRPEIGKVNEEILLQTPDTEKQASQRRVTINIPLNIGEQLPDEIYTLMPCTIVAILIHSGVSDARFICRKFLFVHHEFCRARRSITDMGTTIHHYHGRLFGRGNNTSGQLAARAAWIPSLVWIRVPPVWAVWCAHGTTVASTVRGLVGWGHGTGHKLVGPSGCWRKPRGLGLEDVVGVKIEHDAIIAWTYWAIFVTSSVTRQSLDPKVGDCGWIRLGGAAAVWTGPFCTMIETEGRLLICGPRHLVGPGDRTGTIDVGPVGSDKFPPIVDVLATSWTTYVLCESGVAFAGGDNHLCQLGVGDEAEMVRDFTQLPFKVTNIVSDGLRTIFICPEAIMCCGLDYGLLGLGDDLVRRPSPMKLAPDIRKIGIGHDRLFAIDSKGVWRVRTTTEDSHSCWEVCGQGFAGILDGEGGPAFIHSDGRVTGNVDGLSKVRFVSVKQ
ncbi:hypothetical protein J8273_2772 [Carpediemonas membranifera]|uniref:Uncharacterized protein n=1 Tax=Carpediemonas membranifera TaxID=201153 RepID=A0A8J6E5J9_9EUKA|nr:hypothetical protein J8273_2772 [Carpediemonas membranifera]|eukprot:KAG9395857.1 hypothetical protein J8273_2772 [Carpediemonas membranifera]